MILPTGSTYADQMPRIIQDVRRAIANEFSWRLPFDAYNLLPGERQGQLMVNSLATSQNRPDLDEVRLGRMAKTITLTLWHQIAFDSDGMTGDESVLYADALFLTEAVALEHRIGRVCAEIDCPEWVEKLVVTGPIDPRRSTPLKDGGRTWVLDVTTDLALSFFVNADIYGRHVPIYTSHQSL